MGDVNTPCPSFDMVGSAKWKSWSSYKGLSKEYDRSLLVIARDAEAKYVDFVTKLVPLWKKADEIEQIATTEGNVASSDSGFGLKVSTMSVGYSLVRGMMRRSEEDWKEGDDVFYYMGEKNEDKVLHFIQTHPEEVNQKDGEGRTCSFTRIITHSLLHWACDRGSSTIVDKLVEQGADVSLKDNEGLSALDYALTCEQYDIASTLV